MRFLILALFLIGSLNIFGCDILGISNNGGETKPDTLVDIKINGKEWNNYFTQHDSIVSNRVGANLAYETDMVYHPQGVDSSVSLSTGNTVYYASPYHEDLTLKFQFPVDYNFKNFEERELDLHTIPDSVEYPGEYIRFTEWDYDVIIGEYNRYDPGEEATIEITEWNYEERQLEVEFDVTLLLDENVIEHRENYNTNDHYRRADTLDIEGTIRTHFEDHREN